jgi:nitrite reductase/ring-hydroxylating ferredoxin subunit
MGIRNFLKRKLKGTVKRDAPPKGPLPASAVCWLEELPRTFVHEGVAVAVFKTPKGIFAIDAACVHEDGPLGEGAVEDAVVTCPYHDWRYDLRTGECLSHPGRRVGCFAVHERLGAVYLGVRKSESSVERGGDHDDGLNMV